MIIPFEFEYFRPSSIREAVDLLSEEDSIPIGGGTDLVPMFKDALIKPGKVVSLKNIPETHGIEFDGERLSIGSAVTLTEIAENGVIREHFNSIATTARNVASPQIRNLGTIGGNLCQNLRCPYYRLGYPCHKNGGKKCFAIGGESRWHSIFGGKKCFAVNPSDMATILIAHGAVLEIAGRNDTIPLEELYEGPGELSLKKGEIITRIYLERRENSKAIFMKFRLRGSIDFALVSTGIRIDFDGNEIEDASIILGSVYGTPYRAINSEEFLKGNTLTDTAITKASELAVEGAKPLKKNKYKVKIAKTLVKRGLETLRGG